MDAAVPDIYANAALYQSLGWSLLPIKAGTKQPAMKSLSRVRRSPADASTVRDWFYGRDDLGVAVWLGTPSGGVVARDYDSLTAYQRWKAAFPQWASTLPTVATARGMHVYCRSDINVIRKFPDGELRGTGYILLPESPHPSGPRYRWVIPPTNAIPRLDVAKIGFASSWADVTESTESTEVIVFPSSAPSFPPPLRPQQQQRPGLFESVAQNCLIEHAIINTLPKGPGHRNRLVFELARALKAIPHLADAPVRDLRPHVERWHRLALPFISTKPLEDTLADFTRAWPLVKYPKGDEPMNEVFSRAVTADLPPDAEQYESVHIKQLVGLCRELQRAAGDAPFYLSCRTAGRLLGVDHMSANRWLFLLQHDGLIVLVKRGDQSMKASRYRYLKPL
jgi:hypothetical protein